jgi:hypothetical protein
MRSAGVMTAYDSTPRAHARPDALWNFCRGDVRFGSVKGSGSGLSSAWALYPQRSCKQTKRAGTADRDLGGPRARPWSSS